ncbi:Uracil-DNA glycosylase [Methylobacterium sp. 174MFSha1.1]|uniref:uracil-DNA glycosylase n=1 Tax=Methylobacterium sp. 174MFSha1.1 TaxID=1502749 RepID=UPI0008DECA98|nr:uracil-DNA glycosylase [Methylobacterium sp. 174MFSha1.1]SFV13388.1 Uracil-DNA glycosylase [Methylobacterium sp. 174MFSha1.1]
MSDGPAVPKSLADPGAVASRHALVAASPHLAPLRRLAERIRAEQDRPVPEADPLDGGVKARLLLLLETPGPATGRTAFVSRDNPTGTAANLFRFLRQAGIPRGDTLIWNAVPWVIHAPGARNRAPRTGEIRAARAYLPPLVALMPDLAVVVLSGRVSQTLAPDLSDLRPGLPVVAIPHPSPTYVCTSPLVAQRISAGLAEAARHLGLAG